MVCIVAICLALYEPNKLKFSNLGVFQTAKIKTAHNPTAMTHTPTTMTRWLCRSREKVETVRPQEEVHEDERQEGAVAQHREVVRYRRAPLPGASVPSRAR